MIDYLLMIHGTAEVDRVRALLMVVAAGNRAGVAVGAVHLGVVGRPGGGHALGGGCLLYTSDAADE